MKVTLQIDTSDREELLQARDVLDGLLGNLAEVPLDESEQDERGKDGTFRRLTSITEPDIGTVWPNLGPNAQRLLWFAAQNFGPQEEFTFEDLAPRIGLNVGSIKAFHRNLSRGLGARGVKVSDVLVPRWDGNRQHYHLPTPIHEVIQNFTLGE